MVKSLMLFAFALACGSEEPCSEDMSLSPGALTLTPEEHGAGWGQQVCAQCHPVWSFHQQDCVGGLDLEELRARTDLDEPESCVACHGDNGVEAWSFDSGEAL